jgi:predicted MPP superfamily phosphohydrolase
MLDGLQLAGLAYDHEISAHLDAKLAGLGLKHDIPNIVLKHVPLQLREVSQAGVNLLLAGHTHGGQVWPFTLATSRYYKKFDYGYKIVNTMQTYISSGAGTWGPPVRIGSISEIVKITLA